MRRNKELSGPPLAAGRRLGAATALWLAGVAVGCSSNEAPMSSDGREPVGTGAASAPATGDTTPVTPSATAPVAAPPGPASPAETATPTPEGARTDVPKVIEKPAQPTPSDEGAGPRKDDEAKDSPKS